VNKGTKKEGFEVCLKICITELQKIKPSISESEAIFNFFDTVSLINKHRILMEMLHREI